MTFEVSLEVRSFQAKKNSTCIDAEAGRNKAGIPDGTEATVSDYVSIFPATVQGAVRTSMLRFKSSHFG